MKWGLRKEPQLQQFMDLLTVFVAFIVSFFYQYNYFYCRPNIISCDLGSFQFMFWFLYGLYIHSLPDYTYIHSYIYIFCLTIHIYIHMYTHFLPDYTYIHSYVYTFSAWLYIYTFICIYILCLTNQWRSSEQTIINHNNLATISA